jgi:16S rRNA (uracil1498-N3)-methyltransferase
MSLHVQLVASLAGVEAGSTVRVEGDEAHHAVAVRRMRVGEALVLTDGLGRSATGEVAATAKRELTVSVSSVESSPRPEPRVVVVQALAKGDRGELAVAVLTEVGVDRIVPWAAARSVADWKGERGARSLNRWQATARESAKQARRSWFPEVATLASTAEVVGLLGSAAGGVVLHEKADASLAAFDVPSSGDLVVVVGPEGGVTGEELAAFEGAGATAVRLGSEVLRTSTAGVAAVAALLSRTPRWRSP